MTKFMSTIRTLSSRAGLTPQDVLADGFSMEQQEVSGETLKDLNLTGIVFNETIIVNCLLVKDDFSGDQFYSSRISKTTFTNCDFTNCDLFDVIFTDCIFNDCTFEKCEFYNCIFESCIFFNTNMSWTCHASSLFTGGKIHDSLLQNAIFSNCSFLDVQLQENNVTNIKLLQTLIKKGDRSINNSSSIEIILSGKMI